MATVPAAQQTLDILRLLSAQAGPVPAAVIVRELGLPRSTVYHLLGTLVENGFVTHLPEDRRYALGIAAYELGTGYTRQAPLQRLARVPLADLVDRCGHTAHLAVQHGREVVYVIEERAPGRPPLVTDVGRAAAGAADRERAGDARGAAGGPDPRAVPRPGRVRAAHRGRAALAVGAAARCSPRSARRGWADEDGEVSAGWASVAAAVLDHAGHPVAGVAVTFPSAGARRRGASGWPRSCCAPRTADAADRWRDRRARCRTGRVASDACGCGPRRRCARRRRPGHERLLGAEARGPGSRTTTRGMQAWLATSAPASLVTRASGRGRAISEATAAATSSGSALRMPLAGVRAADQLGVGEGRLHLREVRRRSRGTRAAPTR